MRGEITFEVRQNIPLISNSLHERRHFCFDANPCAKGIWGLRRNRNVWWAASSKLSHFELESTSANKSLQATRDGVSSSASRFTLVGPARLSSGR